MSERFDLIEFGQIFSRFGSRVTIVDALERIAPPADADASGRWPPRSKRRASS
jgi:pyruvate/2-oxoglutarate dehydrogenase complex dihydrolipoamide dehydrogenase (E3) component